MLWTLQEMYGRMIPGPRTLSAGIVWDRTFLGWTHCALETLIGEPTPTLRSSLRSSSESAEPSYPILCDTHEDQTRWMTERATLFDDDNESFENESMRASARANAQMDEGSTYRASTRLGFGEDGLLVASESVGNLSGDMWGSILPGLRHDTIVSV